MLMGARPYLRRRPSGSVQLFLGLHTQKQSLPVSPFLERFLDGSDLGYSSTAELDAVLEEASKLLGAYASAIESNL
jgi:hypothetical protein